MQVEHKLGAGSDRQMLSGENDPAQAESAPIAAETDYEKARIEVRRAAGSILEDYGISIDDARNGVVEEDHSR
jgi:outer membrane protein TolC